MGIYDREYMKRPWKLAASKLPELRVLKVKKPLSMTREPISKKLRFEVFKRDSFRCQYCGNSAPGVILEIDHVTPVASGGKSDILNLITSCNPCNSGKGKRSLSDGTAISKQLDQLKELQERREQLDMMIQWKEELSNLKADSLSRVAELWAKRVEGYSLNDNGMRSLRKLASRFELQEIMDAIDIAAD
jgi:5-methylcytosine-specific restriction endonuclease McrA